MTTVLPADANLTQHHLKISILDQFALIFGTGFYNGGAFELALSTPAVSNSIPEGFAAEAAKDVNSGTHGVEIFRRLGFFNEFELAVIDAGFSGGSISTTLQDLSAHLKDYWVV